MTRWPAGVPVVRDGVRGMRDWMAVVWIGRGLCCQRFAYEDGARVEFVDEDPFWYPPSDLRFLAGVNPDGRAALAIARGNAR